MIICASCFHVIDDIAHVRDNKIYHPECVEAIDKAAAEKANKFPDVEQEVIDGLAVEGELDLLEAPFCLVLSTANDDWSAHAFDELSDLEKTIKTYFICDDTGGCRIHNIYKHGKPANYKINVSVKLEIE